MAGKLVGGAEESVERDDAVLEAEMSEDVLDKVKKSFTDFIKSIEDKIEDSDIKEKKKGDSDLKAKDKTDRDLVAKSVNEDPTEDEPASTDMNPTEPTIDPVLPESKCVKSYPMEDGVICEIHGNEHDGFEIRRGDRCLPTRFKDIDQAEMALKMFQHRRRKMDGQQDYLEEK
jgi:hypothetical protein